MLPTDGVTFRVFGRPAVLRDGRDVTPGPDDHAALLAVLVLRANTVVPDADLVRAAWGAYPPPRQDLYVPELVEELAPAAWSGPPDASSIDRVDGGWVLRVAPGRTDLDVFTTAAGQARAAVATGHVEQALADFREATEASVRPALHGAGGRWFADRRAELETAALHTWVAHADLLVDRWDVRAPYVAAALVERFHDVPACWERHVVALVRSGERDAALTVLENAFRQFPPFSKDPRLAGLRALRDAAYQDGTFPSADLPASDGLPPLRATQPPSDVDVRFSVLTDVAATVDGERIRLDDTERALLALLLLRHPDPVPTALAAQVAPFEAAAGPSDRQRRAEAGLRSLAERLSRDGLRRRVVRPTRDGWVVDVPPDSFDLAIVRGLAAEGRLDDVLASVPPEPLPGVEGPWFAQVRADLVRWRRTLVALRAERLLAAGRPADAVPDLESLARDAPHDETVHADLMRALHAAGRTADALAAYDALAAALSRDLGSSPGPAVRMLRATFAGGARVTRQPAPGADGPGPSSRRRR